MAKKKPETKPETTVDEPAANVRSESERSDPSAHPVPPSRGEEPIEGEAGGLTFPARVG